MATTMQVKVMGKHKQEKEIKQNEQGCGANLTWANM